VPPRWSERTAVVASASFVVAALADVVLPFFYNPQRGTTYFESQFFFLSLGRLLAGPDAEGLKFIIGFGLPAVLTIAGLLLWTRAGRAFAACDLFAPSLPSAP
jgi:hypothetical protein